MTKNRNTVGNNSCSYKLSFFSETCQNTNQNHAVHCIRERWEFRKVWFCM